MMISLKTSIRNVSMVLTRGKYAFFTVFIALVYYAFTVFINNLKVLETFSSLGFGNVLQFYVILLMGYETTVPISSFISTIILSIFIGVLFSLILFKTVMLRTVDNSGTFGFVGIFFGIFAPSCAACGVGLFSLLGISTAGLSFLPFVGIELSIAAIIILLYSILKFSRKLTTCSV